jgi:arylsulfatase A-like enzyme
MTLNRRDFLKISGSALLTGMLSACGELRPPAPTPTREPRIGIEPTAAQDTTVLPMEERPNFVFILTDDLDGVLGTIDYMPYLKEHLIDQGTSLDEFFITTPVCCPSRVSFLRGQYTHNHKVYTNNPPAGSYEKFNLQGHEASTIGTWLQSAGYRTCFMGKYMNHYPFRDQSNYVPPGWTEWYSPVRGKPYYSFNYLMNENGQWVEYGENPEDYLTDVLSGKATQFIRKVESDPSPFLVYISTFMPHGPYLPAPRHSEDFPGLSAPRTASFNEEDVSDKPDGLRYDPPLTEEQLSEIDEVYRLRVQSMQAIDEMIHALLTTLEEVGELENTYIIFTSDNGYHLGQHRVQTGKDLPYDEATHVPFIIRGPQIPKGESLKDIIANNVDFAPTVAALAGVVPPDFVDGRSLVPFLHQKEAIPEKWRRVMPLSFYGHTREQTDNVSPNYLGLRTSEYLYAEYNDGFQEYYDLEKDPAQMENIADQVDPQKLEYFSTWLAEFNTSSEDRCRSLENEFEI